MDRRFSFGFSYRGTGLSLVCVHFRYLILLLISVTHVGVLQFNWGVILKIPFILSRFIKHFARLMPINIIIHVVIKRAACHLPSLLNDFLFFFGRLACLGTANMLQVLNEKLERISELLFSNMLNFPGL